MNTRPHQGSAWVDGRMTEPPVTARPEAIWPEVGRQKKAKYQCYILSPKFKLRVRRRKLTIFLQTKLKKPRTCHRKDRRKERKMRRNLVAQRLEYSSQIGSFVFINKLNSADQTQLTIKHSWTKGHIGCMTEAESLRDPSREKSALQHVSKRDG